MHTWERSVPFAYWAGAAVPRDEEPSPEPGYSLSGRATVDALQQGENKTRTSGSHKGVPRTMPSKEVRDALALRIKELQVTDVSLTAAIGLTGRDVLPGRLRGTTSWRAGDYEAMVAFLDAVEAE